MAYITLAMLTMATYSPWLHSPWLHSPWLHSPWQVRTALQDQGLPAASCDLLFSTLALKDLDALAKVLGDDSAAVRDPPPDSPPHPPLTHPSPTSHPPLTHPATCASCHAAVGRARRPRGRQPARQRRRWRQDTRRLQGGVREPACAPLRRGALLRRQQVLPQAARRPVAGLQPYVTRGCNRMYERL